MLIDVQAGDTLTMNAVARYCDLFKKSGKTPAAFARFALAHYYELCHDVLNLIGCWPSSEPELAALQRA
jgi:hypothetical protein